MRRHSEYIAPDGEWLGSFEGGIQRGDYHGLEFVWSYHYYFNLWFW